LQYRDAITDFFNLSQQVRRDHDRGPLLFQLQQKLRNGGTREWVHARCRLVEYQKFGFVHNRLGKTDALEHALGIRSDASFRGVRQSNLVNHVTHPLM
jgi:hypothetical protein